MSPDTGASAGADATADPGGSYIWPHQQTFRVAAQTAAEGIFNTLDRRLKPSVFLIGIRFDEALDAPPIMVEPDDCGYDPDLFTDVQALAYYLKSLPPARPLRPVPEALDDEQEQRLKERSVRHHIQKVLARTDDSRGMISFTSWPVVVRDYLIIIVIQFERAVFNSYYSLQRNDTDDPDALPQSLLDATVKIFFEGCTKALSEPSPGSSGAILSRDYSEIIRAAGRLMMATPAHAGGEAAEQYGLFHDCNTISSLRYEGQEGVGKLVMAHRGHPNIETVIELCQPVRLRDYRAVRKLLELALHDICLLADAGYIYGLGRVTGEYKKAAENLFVINFTKHYTWELQHAEQVIMWVTYGQPHLPKTGIDRAKFNRTLSRIFGNITAERSEALWRLVLEAIRQPHGTMVVVSTGAADEAERLENQCLKIQPIRLEPELMRRFTAIDGAVLIDPCATCYAIGVILDGLASKKGTPARGARYNSAIRYVHSSQTPCLAIVVSEDESVDLIPDFSPEVHEAAIWEAIDNLRRLTTADPLDISSFNKLMGWLIEHQSYLLPEMCSEINALLRTFETRIRQEPTRDGGPGTSRVEAGSGRASSIS